MSHFHSADKTLLASVDKNLFGDGFAVNLSRQHPKSKEYGRTPVRFVLPTRRAAVGMAQRLVKYGVTV